MRVSVFLLPKNLPTPERCWPLTFQRLKPRGFDQNVTSTRITCCTHRDLQLNWSKGELTPRSFFLQAYLPVGGPFVASSFVIGWCALIVFGGNVIKVGFNSISITFKSTKHVFLATCADNNKKSGINCVYCDRQTVAERRSAPQRRKCAALMGLLPKIFSSWTPSVPGGSRWSPGGLQVVHLRF